MDDQNKTITSTRTSFATSSPANNEEERSSPPTKIRRTSSSNDCTSPHDDHCSARVCGFSPTEFLPIGLRKYRVPEALDPYISEALCDDALGQCLFSGFLNSFETAQLSSISKRFQKIASNQVNRLDVSRCPNLRVEDVTSIVQRFPNLKDLSFDYCKQFGTLHLTALLPLFGTLESLSLRGCKLNDSHLCSFLESMARQNGGFTQLRHLDLSAVDQEGSLRVGDATVESISMHCPDLKTLKLGWCKNVTDSGFATLANSGNFFLEKLDLSLTGITDDSIDTLQNALFSKSTLTFLDLSATQLTGSLFLTSLARYPSTSVLPLRQLSFQFMRELDLESLVEFLDSKSFRRLQSLDLQFSEVADPIEAPHEIRGAVARALARNRGIKDSSQR